MPLLLCLEIFLAAVVVLYFTVLLIERLVK